MKTIDKKTKNSIIYITLHARSIYKGLRWPALAQYIEVQGVVYDKTEFERLKTI